MKALYPDATLRSPTAVDGKSDMRDENIYSAACVSDGGQGSTSLFAGTKGQPIPRLGAGSVNAWQATYSDQTTNLTQNGQLGSSLGDAAFRAIGLDIETAWYAAATGVINTWGAGQREVAEILAKCAFELKIAGKTQIRGPAKYFPGTGGVVTGVASTQATATVGIGTNGSPGQPRRLKLPIMVARTDTIEGVLSIAGGAALSFTNVAAAGVAGQPVLIMANIFAGVKGDAR